MTLWSYSKSTIGGRVTIDEDFDNTENAAGGGFDAGLGGLTVKLLNKYGHVVQTTTTNSDGGYQFQVSSGYYYVQFPTVDGYDFALKDVGHANENSDVNINGVTDKFYIGSDQTNTNIDLSLQSTADAVPTQVCIEAEDMAESGFHVAHAAQASGGQILKLDHGGGYGDASTTFTGVSGTYDLTITAQDENDGHSVIMVKVNGQTVGQVVLDRDTDGIGTDDGGFSDFVIKDLDIKRGDKVSLWVDGDGYEFVRLDKLVFDPAGPATGSVSGNVFCDLDCDGIDDAGVTSISNGANILLDGDFEAGSTQFNLGNYGAWYDAGAYHTGDIIQGTAEGHHGNAADNEIFELDKGSILCQNFNVATAGTYSLTFDTYKNAFLGDHDNDFEVKINGHKLQDVVVRADGQVTIQVDLSAGSNRIDFVSGSFQSGKGPGIDNIELREVITTTTPGEPGKEGVTVKLIDGNGATVATTITDANGDYSFADVALGDYQVMVVAPSGQEFTLQDVGSDDSIDSDVDANGMSGTVTVTADGNVVVDAGLKDAPAPSSVSGRYFHDDNGNDQDDGEPGVAGVLVMLLDANGDPATDANGNVVASVFTGADGSYSFGNLAAGTYSVKFTDPNGVLAGKDLVNPNVGPDATDSDAIGDTTQSTIDGIVVGAGEDLVNNDAGAETPAPLPGSLSGRYFHDDNGNDQDDGEPGVAGVLVTLLDANGDPTGDTAVTGADGSYSFGNLPAGTYSVVFTDPNGVLAGKDLVNPNVGPDATDSDAIGDTTQSTISGITVVAGQDTPDNDAGAETPAPAPSSVSGRYFHDDNGNDQDDGEPGVAGVLVMLLDANGDPATDANGNVVASVFTGADGSYSFGNLAAGTYSVKFTDPNGVLAGKDLVNPNVGPDATDSDAIGDTTQSTIDGIVVGAGEDLVNNDAGAETPAPLPGSLSGRYFHDDNGNDQDDGEPGVAGVLVTLLDANGDPTGDTAVTGADGSYSFGNLPAGTYSVVFTDPNGVLAGKDLVNPNVGPDATDSDAIGDTTQSTIDGIMVVAGQDTPDNDAGAETPAPAPSSVSGRYFHDDNGNDQDDGEPGVAGVLVMLLDANGDPATDANGNVVASVFTGADGSYSFGNLAAGTYSVKFTDPNGVLAGKDLVNPNVGPDATDSDAIGDTTQSTIDGIVVGAGEDSVNNDAGAETPAPLPGSLSGRYFHDDNGNDQDDGEPGVAGVLVTLLDANGDPTGDTAVTGADGSYSFGNLPAGTYSVVFTDPNGVLAGKDLVNPNVGPDATDSDAIGDTTQSTISGITVVAGQDTPDNDAGAETPAPAPSSVSGRYFHDDNGNDQDDGEPGVAGVLVMLLDANGDPATDANGNVVASVFTGADGSYSFGNLAAGTYSVKFTDPNGVLAGKDLVNPNVGPDATDSDAIGDTTQSTIDGIVVGAGEDSVNNDAGAETPAPLPGSLSGRYFHDDNGNDQDDGEPGVAGVLVTLLDANGDPTGDTAVTGADGSYSFGNLPAGTYSVVFTDPNGVLAGKDLVNPNVGPDATDSDAIGDTTQSTISGITVVAGQDTPDNDAGAETPAPAPSSVSGRYFHDDNGNDQDDGEPGVAGVLVMLLDANGDPATDANGNVVASVFTGADGSYSFGNLAAGTYSVKFTDPNGVLAGKDLVNPNVGPDATDSDAIGDTTQSTIDGIVVGAGEDSVNNDAGAETPAPLPGSLSGRYFHDDNGNDQDDGEPGVAGVLVTLLDANGDPTGDTAVTGADGSYSFGNLPAGTYSVVFTDPNGVLAGKDLVNPNVGPDATDSDAIGDTTQSTIDGIVVVAGQDTPDNDAGAETPVAPTKGSISGRYFEDTNNNDVDDGEPGIGGIKVILRDVTNNVKVGETFTDANGDYSFGDLDEGKYKIIFGADPTGKTFVDGNVGGDDTVDSDVINVSNSGKGQTANIMLAQGEDKTDVDAGVEGAGQPTNGSLSGRYFRDTNDNDQDDGEPGVAGVLVTLVDSNGTPTGDTAVTAADGTYSFGDLAPGDYGVVFTDPNGVLANTTLVSPNVGPDATDSDAIGDTTQSSISGITVVAGQDTPDNDAGVEAVPGMKGSISGRYFEDTNNNDVDDGEPGIGGIKVILRDVTNNVKVGETFTDANGDYSFGDLDEGKYKIIFGADPTGKTFVDGNVGGDDTVDSDVINVSNSGKGQTANIMLAQGEDKTDVDAGVEGTAPVGPTAVDDNVGKVCEDDIVTIDALANDIFGTSITSVDGQAISEGGTVILANGVAVSLVGGQLEVDSAGSASVQALVPGQEEAVSFTYHITDANGLSDTGNVDVTFCGEYENLADFEATLPAGQIMYTITDENRPAGSSSDAYTIDFMGTGDARLDGVTFTDAYCLDIALLDVPAGELSVALKGSLAIADDSSFGAAAGVPADQVDNVLNYILNTDYAAQGFTDAEVQGAIWGLFDNTTFVAAGAGESADAQAILDDALANGTTFEAAPGDEVGLIVTPDDPTYQPFIIGIEYQDCLC